MTDIYLQLLSITAQEFKWLCSIPGKHFHEVLNSATIWHAKVSFEQGEYENTKTNRVFKMTINPRWWITSKTLAKPTILFLFAAWQHTGLAFENPARRNSWQSNSLTAKITQIHILGILQNIISDVHILTENRCIHGTLSNYKEVQVYHINTEEETLWSMCNSTMHWRLGLLSCGATAPLKRRSFHCWGFKITHGITHHCQ